MTCLINYLLTGTWPDDPVTPPDEHEWVDLGLPSGTLWATCNVGANTPEEYGDYFAWGETTPKDTCEWRTYKWCNGTDSTLTKYCNNSDYGYNGFVDNKMELDPEDDAAYVNWGPSWRMPTKEQVEELMANCTWEWTLLNGKWGHLGTGPNGNTLFLRDTGYLMHYYFCIRGDEVDIKSRTLDSSNPQKYYSQFFYQNYIASEVEGMERDLGVTVRAVRVTE